MVTVVAGLQQPPDMIVVLGGGIRREIAAAQLAQTHQVCQ